MRKLLIFTSLFILTSSLSFAQIDKTKWVGSVKASSYYTYDPFGEIGTLFMPFSRAYLDSALVEIVLAQKAGIGTSNPGTELDINGTARMRGFELTTTPSDGYVLTSSGGASGIGIWAPLVSSPVGSWQQEVVNNSDNNWTVSFTLQSTSVVSYNGFELPAGQWSGSGTTTLNVSLVTYQYDKITVIQ